MQFLRVYVTQVKHLVLRQCLSLPGEELLVVDGPFTDFKGVVEEVQYEKSRLTLTINVFNRPTQVELEFRQVEKRFNLCG